MAALFGIFLIITFVVSRLCLLDRQKSKPFKAVLKFPMSSMPSITVVLSLLIIQAFSFTATTIYHGQRSGIVKTPLYNSFRHSKSWKQHLLQSRADDDQDETETKSPGIPQLPAIGASSFHHGLPPNLQEELQNLSNAAFVSPKFELQYTCKVCNTRNCHLVSRIGKVQLFRNEKPQYGLSNTHTPFLPFFPLFSLQGRCSDYYV